MRSPRCQRLTLIAALALAVALAAAPGRAATDADPDPDPAFYSFDDSPRIRDAHIPEWFKLSFLDLPADLEEAVAAGKEGIVVYFGQKHCAYCQALMEVNFGLEDIVEYTRRHFDVIPIDIWSDREVVTMDGETLTEKAFAERERTNFTPSLLFYDREGREVLRLRGYYPPYQFRAALEYVADGHYASQSFREYLDRAEPGLAFPSDEFIEEEFFSEGPHILDRSRFPASRPLVVFFEQADCHACDVLHSEPLKDDQIVRALEEFEAVQLGMWSDTPVLTPDGERLTARQWAARLGIFYAPTMVFFDEGGREILRIDSVVQFHRLKGVLEYVGTRAYREQPYYQRWREERLRAASQ
jgi:thioredoxin-related protein